jgi:hypothetical protein
MQKNMKPPYKSKTAFLLMPSEAKNRITLILFIHVFSVLQIPDIFFDPDLISPFGLR